MTQDSYKSPALLIDGQWISDTGASQPVTNPATGEKIGAVPLADAALIDRALQAAQRGFETWRATAHDERAAIMKLAAGLLRERLEEAARHMTLEQGKPLAEARAEMESCAALLEWCPDEAARIETRDLPERPGFQRLSVRREPIGPVAAFSPWNFPASLAGRKTASALSVGCSVIVKPAEETPACFGYVARALQEAGLPDGVLNVLYGDPAEVSTRLIESPVIRKIAFTGSTAVGCKLAAQVGAQAKPCVMELGGHAPVVVCDDADIARAAELSVVSKYRNAGQVCVSPTRFFVQDKVYDAFVDAFVERAGGLRVGDGLDPETQMGPLANDRRVEAIDSIIRDAVAKGADRRLGGELPNVPGNYYPATVLADVPDEARVMQEEPFGPLAVMNRFSEIDEVLERANGTPFALGAYAFTRSRERIAQLSEGLDAGMVGMNGYSIVFTDSPLGGRRFSGYGSEGGREGIEAYLMTKFVSEH